MLREQGRIVAVEGPYAEVQGLRQSACGSCGGESSCNTLSGGSRGRFQTIRVLNPIDARVGELVIFEIPERSFLKASFLAYALPVVALFLVGSLVRSVFIELGFPDAAEPLGALSGLLALGLVFYGVGRYAGGEGREGFYPVVSEVVIEHSTLTFFDRPPS
ncbi:SoxR reducing system RseC family protein [Magnetococcales bacterium HHB-1]